MTKYAKILVWQPDQTEDPEEVRLKMRIEVGGYSYYVHYYHQYTNGASVHVVKVEALDKGKPLSDQQIISRMQKEFARHTIHLELQQRQPK